MGVNPSNLSYIWYIGLVAVTKMLKATTQRMLRLSIMPILRRYRADRMFDWPRIKGVIYTDMMAGRYKSLDINLYALVFSNYSFFAAAYPMEKKILV